MMRGSCKKFSAVVSLMLAVGASQPLIAVETNSAPAALRLAPSPVKLFRELLVMEVEERTQQLQLRPPEMREPIEAKVKEYLALNAEERELRLQATELRHYLTVLMPLPATNRAALVVQIAEPMRAAVVARLEVWNLMPPTMQEEVLENEQVVRHFTQCGAMSAAQRQSLLASMPADQRSSLETNIARWKALPEVNRKGAFAQMNHFFELTTSERERAMRELSPAERDAMKLTLDTFNDLTPAQRQSCLLSFEKFASMSLTDRQIFLKKAEAWQKMTPSDRQHWRDVVARAPELPPFPPGMDVRVVIPPQSEPSKTAPAMPVNTNGG